MLALFGWLIFPDFDHAYLAGGGGEDAEIFVWSLKWWPHALGHLTDPLFTTIVWAPEGLNLANVTTIPSAAIVMAPLTLAAGPIVAFNVLALAAPPLAAWTAYLLCHRITRSFPASLAGGFIYGFSANMWMEQAGGHLNLSLAFLLPVVGLLFVRRLEGSLGRPAFVALLAIVLVVQFGLSTELTALLTLMMAIVVVVSLLLGPGRWHRAILETAGLAVVSFAIAAALVSPYLYAAFARPQPMKAFHPVRWSTDLANFVVPDGATLLGHPWTAMPAVTFGRLLGQSNGYLGGPLILALVSLGISGRRRFEVRVLLAVLVAAAVLALGPVLRFAGDLYHGPLPWRLILHLPLISQALPGRMMAFVFLAAGVGLAVWTAARSWRIFRWIVAGVAVVSMLPNVQAPLWPVAADQPELFTTGEYRRYLHPGETVVVVSFNKGDEMLWQADTDMSFRLAGGYLGLAPPHYGGVHFFYRLQIGDVSPDDKTRFRRFVRAHGVTTLIAYRPKDALQDTLNLLTRTRPLRAGGVLLYRMAAPAT
jgi:hypothetical protein